MIEIKNVTLGYDKEKPLFKDLNLKIHRGQITCIIAPRGSGKTTLLNTLTGNKYVFDGTVRINGIDNESKYQQNDCKLLYQNFHLYNNLTVLENIKFRQIVDGFTADATEVERKLIQFNLFEEKEFEVSRLNQFEKKQLGLLLTLLSEPSYLLLDDPTALLNYKEKEYLWSKLRELANEDKAIVVVASTVDGILDYDRAIVLKTGKVIWDDVQYNTN